MYISDTKIEEIVYRENLKVAPIGRRILAYLIDEFLILSISYLVFRVTINFDYFQYSNYLDFLILACKVWLFVRGFYYFIFVLFCGVSIGKILTKIRVVMIDTLDSPDLLFSLVRILIKELGTFFLFSTYFFAFDNNLVRTLHDRVAKTIVVT
ncbi:MULTISPECIES: RDD family protein [unclassified Helicobacter]|uniref:RDD family protein n=1 Tax=unclassified Helicobacter TaxID=2593540 RepID=UPI000CF018C5|nr:MULTISPECIES: RDD family protein [unclassified Helicobacter]